MHEHHRNLPSLSRRLGAFAFAGLVFVLGLLAVAPEWHERVHVDSHEATHSCAITLFAHGTEAATMPVLLAAPAPYRAARARFSHVDVTAASPRGLPPSCGPPQG